MNISSIDWYKDVDDSDLEFVEEGLKLDFAVGVEKAMKYRGVNKKELASKIDTSQAYISKVLRGDANVTIATMAKLSHALDYCVHLHFARRDSQVRWLGVHSAVVSSLVKDDTQKTTADVVWMHRKYDEREWVGRRG